MKLPRTKIPQELINKYINCEISTYGISKLLNIDPDRIYRHLKKLNIDTSILRKNNYQKERNKEIIKLYKTGLSVRKISFMYNRSRQRIHQIIRRHINEI